MSLNELFARDPLELKDEDISSIVEALREQRKNFDLGVKPAKAAKPKATKASKDAATGELSLETLGLSIGTAKPKASPKVKPDPKDLPDPKTLDLSALGF